MNDRTHQLVRYDAMCHAISECHSVDEVKDIHDKALAMQLYAKQALNLENERQAAQIRLRAERKAGDLMRELERRPGARNDITPSSDLTRSSQSQYAETLERAGVSRQTAKTWQDLSRVPEEKFEQALGEPGVPSTGGILAMTAVNGSTQMDDDSLWLWGRLRDFERRGIFERSPAEVYGGMTDTMQTDAALLLPIVIDWLVTMREIV